MSWITAAETIVKEFDLMKVYEIDDKSMEKTLKALSENSAFSFDEDGRVVIEVWDTNPKRAAEMAFVVADAFQRQGLGQVGLLLGRELLQDSGHFHPALRLGHAFDQRVQ